MVIVPELLERQKKYQRYGWTTSEDNLATLPVDAPQAAKDLATWLTLEGRRSSLVEWLGVLRDDSRIHGDISGIGAWTGRCSHSRPNTANISAAFHGDVKTAVDAVKAKYDARIRALWQATPGTWLVGVDAEGIQLRILADYLWRHFDTDAYAMAIHNGKKENETDIHNVNKRALGLNHITRDDSKVFIYSWVLNSGVEKTAQILKCNTSVATDARQRFEASIQGLSGLKNELLPYIADRGWFTGYDGRKVPVPSLHKTLAGILQNGEAVVMKHAILKGLKEIKASGINAKIVGFIHDETQTEVNGTKEEADEVGRIQKQAIADVGLDLGFKCPLLGSADIGRTWNDTH